MRTAALFLLASAAASAQPDVAALLRERTLARIRTAADACDGIVGMAAIDLTDGHTLDFNGDTAFPQASSIKIAILVEVFRAADAGRLRLDDTVTLEPGDAVAGSGRLQVALRLGPVRLTLLQLATAMMEHSDNAATNRLIDLAGLEAVNRTLDSFGLTKTRLRRKMLDIAAARENRENTSSPVEMARLAERIYRGRAASPESCRRMLEIMKLAGGEMREAVPDGVEVASKPGRLDGVRCETCIVFLPGRPFALSVASTYLEGRLGPVPAITDVVCGYFARLSRSNRYGRKLE